MKIVRSQTLHSGHKFDLIQNTLLTAAGEELQREYMDHPGAVVLLPILEGDRVVLVRNYRHSIQQTLLELPAGTMHRGDSPDATAARELKEETGYTAGSLEKLLVFFPSPGVLNELMYLFVAEKLTRGAPSLEKDEELETEILPFEQALAMTRDGRIVDGKTMIGLWHWAHLRAVASGGAGA